ncbi:hypothetical protein DL764_010213 [Monosporascus ibericus]|uniref:Uncharacterized protein n=1 Tax=Monosporascus ibericus TaxID=155417 RepID=A0A4Q4ST41_9PEZI|nr:hypothetical protein DL764_010213 [Monosporascus ibericus]
MHLKLAFDSTISDGEDSSSWGPRPNARKDEVIDRLVFLRDALNLVENLAEEKVWLWRENDDRRVADVEELRVKIRTMEVPFRQPTSEKKDVEDLQREARGRIWDLEGRVRSLTAKRDTARCKKSSRIRELENQSATISQERDSLKRDRDRLIASRDADAHQREMHLRFMRNQIQLLATLRKN